MRANLIQVPVVAHDQAGLEVVSVYLQGMAYSPSMTDGACAYFVVSRKLNEEKPHQWIYTVKETDPPKTLWDFVQSGEEIE